MRQRCYGQSAVAFFKEGKGRERETGSECKTTGTSQVSCSLRMHHGDPFEVPARGMAGRWARARFGIGSPTQNPEPGARKPGHQSQGTLLKHIP